MDKILLIDAHNQLWRASINFSYGKQKHTICAGNCNHKLASEKSQHDAMCVSDCKHKLHSDKVEHCTCGQKWQSEDNKCFSQANQDFVLIFNFFRNLRPIIEEFSPDKCFFVLEGHPQFRYDLYADYKANRLVKNAGKQDTLDKFHASKREVIRLMQYLPLTTVRAANYECDDVISTLCENMKDEHLTVLSNDSDYIQLLQRGYKNCQIYNPIKKEFMVAPEYSYVAWKSLNGDKSDNIPALVKPKKALELINNATLFFDFLRIKENKDNFYLNKDLIQFRDVPEEEIVFKEGTTNFDILKQEFDRMKFDSIIKDTSWNKFCQTFKCLKF